MRILGLIGAILALIATPAMAKDGRSTAWIVTQKSGQVQVVRSGFQPASVNLRAALAAGDIVATGADGRAMLTRGDDYVIVAPGSRLLLPKEEQRSGFTRLIQQVGTMLYKVRHTGVPHFAVDTPMLAAVVKGTSFTVVVDKDRTAVQVTDGVVEVSSAAGSSRRLVERGMTVYVGRERPKDIIEVGSGALDLPNSSSDGATVTIEASGDIPLSTITNLTNGLVQEARVTPVAAMPTLQPLHLTAATHVTDAAITAPDANVAVPTVANGDVTAPSVSAPAVGGPAATIPSVSTPATTIPAVTAPAVTTPAITTPIVTVPSATIPAVTVPSVSIPTVTTPTVTVPTVTVPAVTIPSVSIPTVTTPTVTTPTITTPTITVPAVTTPTVTVPTVTTPTVTVPTVTVPTVTVPAVTIPAVTTPSLPLLGP